MAASPDEPSSSEYDPVFASDAPRADAEEPAFRAFRDASRAYLSSPVSWLVWALVLPATALSTATAYRLAAERGVLALWSVAILLGGAVEGALVLRGRRRFGGSRLASWAMSSQGNLSLVAVVLSGLLLWRGEAWMLPGLWLLLLGHSFFDLGGLAWRPLRVYGVIYQLGGALALLPEGRPLAIFAATTAIANLWMSWSVARYAAASRS
ncbi:MAG: hypothetical protein U0X73_12550 [Thermoanaerobaculia bacterium]